MIVVSKFKIIITASVCLLGLLIAAPSALNQKTFDKLPKFLQHTVSLGLELRGGSHIQLEVDIASVEKEHQESIVDEARKQLRKQNVKYKKISVIPLKESGISQIVINLSDDKDVSPVKKILSKIEPGLDITAGQIESEITATISKDFLDKFAKRIVGESIEVIRHRIDESGTKEPTILRQGNDRIIVQLPGVENPEDIKKLLGKTALLTFHGVDEEMETINAVKGSARPKFPVKPGVMYLPEERSESYIAYVPIKKQISLTGKSLIDAQMNIDPQSGQPCVSIKFDNIEGTRKIAELSAKYLHKQFAMVLDGKVLSAPVFQAVLTNGSAVITGRFTMKEANELALLLRAGSLPAPLKVVEERNIGPSLGSDSILEGKMAVIIAFIFVSLFMIASYGRFGVFSVVSLLFNIIILFASLTLLGATLTLPGIAGIALTIGMAVDSNVLIYERIREEIRLGIKQSIAIAQGYKMATMTIIDSNFTTLVGSLVLYEFGSGPIKGFAVTLALGTLISLFTTFSLTKSIIAIWLKKGNGRNNNDIII
ncbi:MAG: protein translocase subunit SecD [Holosporales bacterium]|jgi:preprotein translocase subunit SecD|nr:protein translocase subunit SecD [Holosporales bacterium]